MTQYIVKLDDWQILAIEDSLRASIKAGLVNAESGQVLLDKLDNIDRDWPKPKERR